MYEAESVTSLQNYLDDLHNLRVDDVHLVNVHLVEVGLFDSCYLIFDTNRFVIS